MEGLRPCLDEETLHASAARCWEAGVDGLYLFNYYRNTAEWKRRVLGHLMDPESLTNRAQRYELDHTDRIRGTEGHGAAFNHAHPDASLPVILMDTSVGGGAELSLRVACDMDASRDAVLGMGLEGYVEGDELEVDLNDSVLPWTARRTSDGWSAMTYDDGHLAEMGSVKMEGVFFQFDVAGLARRGVNRLRVRLVAGATARTHLTKLVEVRLDIEER